MSPADQLAVFVRDALAAGHTRDEAAEALRAAGWAEAEIGAALDAWAETPFRPPVPRPRRHVSASEAFFYGLTFIALATTIGHVVGLWFALIAVWLPGPGDQVEVVLYAADGVRWSLAVLAVVFPLFLWMDARGTRAALADPARRRSAVRRWFAHVTLFLAVLGLLGDLVAVVYAFLSGEVTLRFLAKAAVVAALAGAVLLYFRPLREEAPAPPFRPALWALAALILVPMALGLWAVGGPAAGRSELRDQTRVQDLAALAGQVECRAEEEGALPADAAAALDPTPGCPATPRRADPWTGAPYGYARVTEAAFRLCAGFETDRGDRLGHRASGFDPATGCLTFRLPPRPGG